MAYFFALGFLFGLRHALDADHVALFGVGSMIGMAALSLTIALPMKRCAGLVTWGHNGIHAVIGVGTVALGGVVVAGTASTAAGWLALI